MFPNGSFSSVSILEGWLLICSICSASLLWAQPKPPAPCRGWPIQAAVQAFTCDNAAALASLRRAGDRRRGRVAAGEFASPASLGSLRAAGSPGAEGTAASSGARGVGGFVVSSQMGA